MKRLRRKKTGGRNKIPLAGKTFGRLKVLRDSGRRTKQGKAVLWLCRCSCGKKTLGWGTALRKGWKKSCGCLSLDKFRERSTTHGMTRTGTHRSWSSMKERCLNPNNQSYCNYGGRGVTICARWLDKKNGFINFFADMGERPADLTLDRIDNDKLENGYSPRNCRWATKSEQMSNRRCSVRNIEEEIGIM